MISRVIFVLIICVALAGCTTIETPKPTLNQPAVLDVVTPNISLTTTEQLYQEGNTVRFFMSFRNFTDNPSNATNVHFKVYNKTYTQILDWTNSTWNATGVYYIDYTLPYNTTPLYVEMYGTVDSSTLLKRSRFTVGFA